MSDSNNITVLNSGVYKNLLAQVEAIYKHSNELSFKTRARYFEATKRFCKFLADNFRLQNFKNVDNRHFKAYVEHLKEKMPPQLFNPICRAYGIFTENQVVKIDFQKMISYRCLNEQQA